MWLRSRSASHRVGTRRVFRGASSHAATFRVVAATDLLDTFHHRSSLRSSTTTTRMLYSTKRPALGVDFTTESSSVTDGTRRL